MIRNFLKTLVSLSVAAFAAVSCTPESEAPEITFPEAFDVTVTPGTPYTFSITAEQEWTVSIPADEAGTYFWIDEGRKVYTTGGQAGTYEIKIGVTETQDLEDHSVTVSMTMGGETSVIGKLTLPAMDYSTKVFKAVFNESIQDFETGKDLTYEYETVSIAAGEVIPLGRILGNAPVTFEFETAFLVESNLKWKVTSELPAWLRLEYGKSTSTGRELIFTPNFSALPENKADAQITITSTFEEKSMDFSFTIVFDPTVEFNITAPMTKGTTFTCTADGKIGDSEVQTTLALSLSELSFYNLDAVTSGEGEDITYEYSAPEGDGWVNFAQDSLGKEVSPDKVRNGYMLTMTVDANESETARTAAVVVLPASLKVNSPADLLDGTSLKAEYADFLYYIVNQEGKPEVAGNVLTLTSKGQELMDSDPGVIEFKDVTEYITTWWNSEGADSEGFEANVDQDFVDLLINGGGQNISETCPAYQLIFNDITVEKAGSILTVNTDLSGYENYPGDATWLTPVINSDGGLSVSMTGTKGSYALMKLYGTSSSTPVAYILCKKNY